MIEIKTIREFLGLTKEQQGDICRNINTIGNLKQYLVSLNNSPPIEPKWVPCKKCQMKGWVYEVQEERNNADIHASQIHKCLKALVYSCTDKVNEGKRNVSAEARLTFDHGHSLHHMLQGYGKKGAWGAPIDYSSEVAILPDADEAERKGERVLEEAIKYQVRSSVDAVLWSYIVHNVRDLGSVNIRLLHEYKSIHPGRIKKGGGLYGGFADLQSPQISHKQQAHIYMQCLNIPLTVFLYYNKGDDTIAEFVMPYDPIMWGFIKKKILKVHDYADSNQLPPWHETSAILDSSECNYCEYAHICNPPLVELGVKTK